MWHELAAYVLGSGCCHRIRLIARCDALLIENKELHATSADQVQADEHGSSTTMARTAKRWITSRSP